MSDEPRAALTRVGPWHVWAPPREEAGAHGLVRSHESELRRLLCAPEPRGQAAGVAFATRPPIHLRPVRHGGWLGPLWRGRVLGPGRCLAELRSTRTLPARGAPVPEARFVLGLRAKPGWYLGFATTRIQNSRNGLELVRDGEAALESALPHLAQAVRDFHEKGGRHADLHLGNLVCHEAGPAWVIDLDRGRADDAPCPLGRRERELRRLRRSFDKAGARAHWKHFVSLYAGDEAALTPLAQHVG